MKSMRRILITAALIATLSLTALASTASTAPSTGYAFPSAFKKGFIKECAKARGASRSECRCAVRKLERAYTWKQFKRVLRRVERTGKFPPKAQRLIRSCAN